MKFFGSGRKGKRSARAHGGGGGSGGDVGGGGIGDGLFGNIKRFIFGGVFVVFVWRYTPGLLEDIQDWWHGPGTDESGDVDDENENVTACEDSLPQRSLPMAVWSKLLGTSYITAARLLHHLNSLDRAVSYYSAATELNPCDANAHYTLGYLRAELNDEEAAEASFTAALNADPKHAFAYLRLQAIRSRRSQQEFWNSIISIVNGKPEILKSLVDGASVADIRKQVQSDLELDKHFQKLDALLAGTSPLQFAAMMPPAIEHDLPQLLAQEEAVFKDISTEPATARISAGLMQAMRDMHEVTRNASWAVGWALERLARFGDPNNRTGGEYGRTWYMSWLKAMRQEHVRKALRLQPGNTTVVIVGSGLGYQCLFAMVSGAVRCVGYDVMCRSLVDPSREIIAKHGLQHLIELKCLDARLSTEFANASLVWMNDAFFPPNLREQFQLLMVHHLQHDGVAVSYAPAVDHQWRKVHLQPVDVVRVMLSWTTAAALHILVKHPPFLQGPQGISSRRSQSKRKRGKRSSMSLPEL